MVVKPQTGLRLIRAVDTIAINLLRLNPGQINMPNVVVVFRDDVAFQLFRPGTVKQTQFDLFGMSGEQGKVHSLPVITRTQWISRAA